MAKRENIIEGVNWLLEYKEAIDRGKIIVGQEMLTGLEMYINDMDNPRYYFDNREANFRIEFIETFCKHSKDPYTGNPFILELWQKAFITCLYSFKMSATGRDRFKKALLLVSRKNGKALDLETPIPTPNGIKKMRDLQVGDTVYGVDGKETKIIATSPIFENHVCYEITFEDGDKIIADEEHLWSVQTREIRRLEKYECKSNRKPYSREKVDKYGYKTITTKEMVNNFKRNRKDGKGIEYKYRVPMNEPIEFKEKELKLSPYVMGVWLGDGTSENTDITCGKEDIEEMLQLLKKENVIIRNVKDRNNHYMIGLGEKKGRKNNVKEALKQYNVINNKHIPEEYLTASIEQRKELLKGLMDTDGYCSKKGQCEFVQKSKNMIDGFSRLLSSLGIKHNVRKKTAKCNSKECEAYSITFYVDKENTCFKFKRKTERVKEHLCDRMKNKSIVDIKEVESRPTKCIMVDNERNLYLCGNKNTVTHNSTLIAALAFTELMVGGAGKDVVCSANNDEQSKIIFEEIANMTDQFDPKMKRVRKNRDKIEFKKNRSKIKRVSDRKKNILGLNINFAVCDETNELEGGETPSKLIKSMSLKPNPKFINITTEGMVFDGYLDNELIKARQVLDGERSDASSESLLIWLYTQDSEQEIYTITADTIGDKDYPCVWQKSNPSLYSVKDPQYLLEQLAESRIDKNEKLQTLVFDFNIKSNTNESWLDESMFNYPMQSWNIEEFRNHYALGGVDLSFTNDLTCAKILLMRSINPETGEADNQKYILTKYFIPEAKLQTSKDSGARYEEWVRQGLIEVTEGNQNDLTKVADWFGNLYKEYGIKTFMTGYDDRFSNDFKNRMNEWGLEYEMILQNRFTLSDPMKSVEADLKSQLINYNDNPIDKWCFANTCMSVDKQGFIMPEKIKNQPDRKIDGSATIIILYATLKRYRTEFMNKVF